MEESPELIASIWLAMQGLTTLQCARLNIAMQLGIDPRDVDGYHAVDFLFTEKINGMPAAHNSTREIFARLTLQRIRAEQAPLQIANLPDNTGLNRLDVV